MRQSKEQGQRAQQGWGTERNLDVGKGGTKWRGRDGGGRKRDERRGGEGKRRGRTKGEGEEGREEKRWRRKV